MRNCCLTKRSVPVETGTLIDILPSENEGDTLFVPRQAEDSALVELWHNTVLLSMQSTPEEWDGLTSAHLFRQGQSEQESQPVILISVDSDSDDLKISLRIPIGCADDNTHVFHDSKEKISQRRTIIRVNGVILAGYVKSTLG